MGILDKLRGRQSAKDLDAALPDIAAEISAQRTNLEELRASLRTAPFESTPDEVRALRQRIRDTEDELELLEGVAADTVTRRNAAERAESRLRITGQAAVAEKARARMRSAAAEYDAAISALVGAAQRMRASYVQIEGVNQGALDAGFEELQVRAPMFAYSFDQDGAGIAAVNFLRGLSPTAAFKTMESNGQF